MRVLIKQILLTSLLIGLFIPTQFVFAAECWCGLKNTDCSPITLKGSDCESDCKTTYKENFDKILSGSVGTESACTIKHNAFLAKEADATKAAAAATTTPSTPPKSSITPTLNIEIPGLTFSPAVISASTVKSNFLADYINAIYLFLIGAGVVFVIIMVMIGGLQYTIGAGSEAQIGKGKERIRNAITGLVLLLCTFLILKITNPQLVTMKMVELQNIPEQPMPEERAVSGEFGKKMLKDFAAAPPDKTNPTVPPASDCSSSQSKRNREYTTQADRDAAYAIQKQYGYPAAVFLAQRILEGKTFGIKCGGYYTAERTPEGDEKAKAECASNGPLCGSGYTWECTKKAKYLPGVPDGAYSPKNNTDCGKGDKAGQGYKAVHGYSCFQKADPASPFGPLLKFYEKRSCFKGAKDKYGGNPEAFAYAVQACGYATAQGYAGTLVNIMKKNCLYTGPTKAPTDSTTSDATDAKTETSADTK